MDRTHRTQILALLKQNIAKEKDILFAYLYGSFLNRKDARDIDVAVYLKDKEGVWEKTENMAGKLEKAINHIFPVDVHALNNATAAFRFQVISKGRLISEKKKENRLNFEAHTVSAYLDLKPMMNFHDHRYLSL